MSDQLFHRRTRVTLVAVFFGSLLLAIVFGVLGPDIADVSSSGADTFSRSALGHHAFVELLRELSIPVVVSRHDSAARAGPSALLVIAEPHVLEGDGPEAERLQTMVDGAHTVLLVLPKWMGTADPRAPGWIESAELRPVSESEAALEALGVRGSVIRRPSVSDRARDLGGFDAVVDVDASPILTQAQLLESDEIGPLLSHEGGILVGQITLGGTRLVILSDPDLLSNHGLGRGDNARLATQLVQSLLDPGEAVIFDETLHGRALEPSLWRALFEFPLALVTVHVFAILALLLWTTARRFGTPLPPPPPVAPGKDYLIRNTAELLRFGGHAHHALSRYLEVTIQDAARILHVPGDTDREQIEDWLNVMGERRSVSVGLSALRARVDALSDLDGRRDTPILSVANRIARWRWEMTHGPGSHQGH